MTARDRIVGGAIGLVFGFTIVWSGMTSPEVIREALLFESAYLYLFMASAMATATVGLALLRRYTTIAWTRDRIERRHVVGALIFGLGWGLTDVCPGPLATQLGEGIGWALPLAAGVVAGVRLHQRQGRVESEPADEPAEPRFSRRPAADRAAA